MTWSRTKAIGDLRVCFTLTSEDDAGAAKRVLLYIPDPADAFPSDILVSLSRSLATE